MGALHRILAGHDGPGRRALPASEFLHPVPLLALATLAVNDHVLKGSGLLPAPVTGKLSDIAGFVFFPLLCTALLDCALWALAHLGVRVDFSLRMGKLYATLAATAALMIAIKLSVPAASTVADALGAIGFESKIVSDATDLWTLPALAIPWWIGRREIARVPLGRLEVLERSWRRDRTPAAHGLRDTRARSRDPAAVDALATALDEYFADGGAAPVEQALARIRG